jgi:hypothetical protein
MIPGVKGVAIAEHGWWNKEKARSLTGLEELRDYR